MTHHVWVRVAGFGRAVLPRATPFRLELANGSPDELVLRSEGEEERLDPTARESSLAEIGPGPRGAPWRIQTSAFELPFPPDLALVSSADPSVPPGFDLLDSDGGLVFFQGPAPPDRWSSVRSLVGAGETLEETPRESGVPEVLVSYAHGGATWWQRRRVVRLTEGSVLLVAAQSTDRPGPGATSRFESVADSVRAPAVGS